MSAINVTDLLENMASQLRIKISQFALENVVIVGIHTGGYWVAQQLHELLKISNPLGSLSISFYRDDFTHIGLHPEVKPSEIPVNVEGKHIILVDDVLYTGRTVRAALNEIFDYGRPASVIFSTLIDRGEQELPICAAVCGLSLHLSKHQQIKLSGPASLALTLVETEEE
ncbi:MAG: bifunctional pyr operon transcriptional regulator/uracil phosphoribosyltransferase PyrR [Pseudomonadota bacterium]